MPGSAFDWDTVGDRSLFDGLDRRVVTPADLVAHSVAVVCPAASTLGVAMGLPFVVGPGAWLSVVLGIGVALLLARTFGEFGSRLAAAGSLYTYAAKGLGPVVALVVGGALLLSYTGLITWGLGAASERVTVGLAVVTGGPVPALTGWLAYAAALLGCLAVLARGVRWSTGVALVTESVALGVLVAVLVVTAARHGLATWGLLDPTGASPGRVLAGAALVATITMGFESSAALGVEAERPFRSIPRSMRFGVGLTGVLFLTGVLVSSAAGRVVGASPDSFGADTDRTPLDVVAILWPAAAFAVCALCAWAALARLVFSLAREGVLPAFLGRARTAAGSPYAAVLAVSPFVVLPALIAAAQGEPPWSGSSDLLLDATLVLSVGYVLTAVAAIAFLHRLGELTAAPAVVAAGAAAGTVVLSFVSLRAELREGQTAPLLWLGTVVAVGLAWAALLRRTRPEAFAQVGRHDAPLRQEVLLPHQVPVGTAWRPR